MTGLSHKHVFPMFPTYTHRTKGNEMKAEDTGYGDSGLRQEVLRPTERPRG